MSTAKLVVCMWGVWEGEVQRYTSGVYVGVMGGGTEVYWWCVLGVVGGGGG